MTMRRVMRSLAVATVLAGAAVGGTATAAHAAVEPMSGACANLYPQSGFDRIYLCKTWYKHEGESAYHGTYHGTLYGDAHGVVLQASIDGRVVNVGYARSGRTKNVSNKYTGIKRLLFRACLPGGAGGAVKRCGGWW
jgi:hypothetical protein